MYEYIAHFDPAEARKAERSFFLLSHKNFRFRFFYSSFVAPVVGFVVFAVAYLFLKNEWLTWFSGILFAASFVGPPFFFFARSIEAGRIAERIPERRMCFDEEGVHVHFGGKKENLPWSRIKCVWETDLYLLLVVSPFLSLNIPKFGMPEGAKQFICGRFTGK